MCQCPKMRAGKSGDLIMLLRALRLVERVLVEEAQALLLAIELLHHKVKEVLGVALVPRGAHSSGCGLGLVLLERRWRHILVRSWDQRALYVNACCRHLVLEEHSR